MIDRGIKWRINDGWSPEFDWFLIDEGKIWYSFQSKAAAEDFQRAYFMSDKLLLSIAQVGDVLMTEPNDYRAWRCKSPVHVVAK